MKNFSNRPYLQTVLAYLLFGVLWIVVTDRLLFRLVPNLPNLVLWQTYKGWFFVAISTLIIYVMLSSSARKSQESQEALAKSEKTYRLLFENNPWPMWVYDLETLTFLAVNEAAVDKYGFSAAEFLAMSIRDIRPDEDVPRLLDDVATTTRPLNFAGEWRHCRKDGTIFPVEITSHSLVHNGRSARLVIANDLTERKQAEAAAREKTEILEKIFDNAPIMLTFIDQNGRFALANREYEQTYGWSLSELQTHPNIFHELYPDPDIRQQVLQAIHRGDGVFREFCAQTRDGQVLDVTFANIRLSDGTSIGIGQDITQRKKIENELKESEARFRRLAENAQDLIYRYRFLPEPGFEYVSPAATAITGYTPQEHYDDPQLGFKLVHPDDRYLLTAVSEGKLSINQPLILRWIRKNGTIIWTEQRNVPIYNENEELVALEGIARDITDRMNTQQALRESERRFRIAIEEAPFPIIIHAEDGEILIINHIWTEITGYQLDEIPTIADWTERAYGVRQEQVQAGIDQLYKTDRRVEEGEFQIMCKDGSQRIWEFSTTPLGALPDGRRTVISAAVDVTERKQAEAALRAKTEELDGYFKYTLDLLCIADTDGRFRRLNKEWEATLGYPLTHLEGQRFMDFVHPDDVAATTEALAQLSNQQEVLHFINRYQHKNGTYRWIEWRSVPANNIIYAAARDITERIETEQQLRLQSAALEAAANGIVITDIDGNMEWANSAFTKLTGYTTAEALGKNPRELIKSGLHDNVFYEEMWNSILNGRTWRGEIINRRKDGTLYTEEEAITPVWDDQGNIAHFIAIKQDITRRKQAEIERSKLLEQLKAQAKQLNQVMRAVPEGVLLLNPANEILLTNPQGEEFVTRLARVNATNQLTHIGNVVLETIQTSPPAGQWHEVRENGRIFEVIARPVESGATPQGWVLVLRDVTEQQEFQNQLQQQERLAAVGQLAAGIAHDFNNIMAVIVLYSQMVAETPALAAKQREQLAIITRQAKQASELIQQILDFSRRSVLSTRPLDFLSLLKKEAELLRRTLPEHIDIKLTSQPGDYMLQADPTRLQQAIMNLAINARDAMPNGGQLRFDLAPIEIKSRKQTPYPGMTPGHWFRLHISDTGSGIDTAVLDHIFEPFFTTKEIGKGTGLGLAQVHGIIGQHGGYITVNSQSGQGTTFTIYLPALIVTMLEDTIQETDVIPYGQNELILVVEDQAALREALVESLSTWQYRVLEASNGEEALARLSEQTEAVQLIISDMIMPKMGGLPLLHNLRQQGWQMPVILMTGHSLDEVMPTLWEHGVHLALTKPVSPAPLAQAIASALESA